MKIITYDLALLPLGVGVVVAGGITGSSEWAHILVMEVAILISFSLEGYFRLRAGENLQQILKAIVVGLAVAMPLMASAIFVASVSIEYVENLGEMATKDR